MHLSDCFLELFTFVRFLTDSSYKIEADYEVVRKDFSLLLDRVESKGREGKFSDEQFDNARFAVFAWADEAILCSSWPGAKDWLKHTLQREYYGTSSAGEEFFERLNLLLGERKTPLDESLFVDCDCDKDSEKSSPVEENKSYNLEILEVYALCLSLGYSGIYFSDHESDRLTRLREDCVKRIVDGQGDFQLSAFPDSYGTKKMSKHNGLYGRVFEPLSIVFLILPLLVLAGVYFAYLGLLENSLQLWLG
ncbi:type VI secretion system protein ImpK [Desulfovibrio gilichinskyi]|uniref:Type VI secretion system protein ImpK n=2 Tax=Desulfovibrio gilichinskyi TaxID=1519643 RepID=A0A1X7D632_9BACT|nr:type VI secretion system protein ImpK [Desulfovibrio gilichinskyi]